MLLTRSLATAAWMIAATGCATVTGTPTQTISIHTVDAADRPVGGMRCLARNDAAEYFGTAPVRAIEVRRSASDLLIECRRGTEVARGTAVSRGSHLLSAMLPGGSAAILIDHVSGYRYSYPQQLTLRVGQHLVFDSAATAANLRAEAPFDARD